MKLFEILCEKILKRPDPSYTTYTTYPLWLLLWKPVRKFLKVAVILDISFNNVFVVMYRMISFVHLGKGQSGTTIVIEDDIYNKRINLVSGKKGLYIENSAVIDAANLVNEGIVENEMVIGVAARRFG